MSSHQANRCRYRRHVCKWAPPARKSRPAGECGSGNASNPCEHLCLDLHDGTYECSCFYGFALALDGYSCARPPSASGAREGATADDVAEIVVLGDSARAVSAQPKTNDSSKATTTDHSDELRAQQDRAGRQSSGELSRPVARNADGKANRALPGEAAGQVGRDAVAGGRPRTTLLSRGHEGHQDREGHQGDKGKQHDNERTMVVCGHCVSMREHRAQ